MLFSSRCRVAIDKIPAKWIFEHYLGLDAPLDGQTVRMNSLLSAEDKDPSMHIFFWDKTGDYAYKCFSANCGGTALDLMTRLWAKLHGWNYGTTCARIEMDYQQWLLAVTENGTKPVPERLSSDPSFGKWKVGAIEVRENWNQRDADYWTRFKITSKMMDTYGIRPLRNYMMVRNNKESTDRFVRSGEGIYGYFKGNGELHKIYQPETGRKFIEVQEFLQGSDNLTSRDTLVLMSSLKDGLALKCIGGKFESLDFVAWRAENNLIPEEVLFPLRLRYERIYTLFDNDATGLKGAERYRTDLGIEALSLPLNKDVADSVYQSGQTAVARALYPQLFL